jgi:hypothetical protein
MDNFDLKKYLVENKVTTNFKMTEETSKNSAIEKAKKLVETFGKELAVKVVEEIQNTKAVYANDTEYDYWEEVKQEIEKYKEQ